jgi:hypothetical protein
MNGSQKKNASLRLVFIGRHLKEDEIRDGFLKTIVAAA